MKLHGNHRTCPSSRLLICRCVHEQGWTLQQAAEAAACCMRTAAKWLKRYPRVTESCVTAPRARGSRGVTPERYCAKCLRHSSTKSVLDRRAARSPRATSPDWVLLRSTSPGT
jgi:hypothetical protein